MRDAIFFTVTRDAKIEVGIGQLGGTADRASMQRFVIAARMLFKPFSPG